jgi:predicted secreted Zn-dependent protease
MKMEAFRVSFQYSERTYCTNIATALRLEDVEKAYSIYKWYSVKEATAADLEEATRKNMPIIQIGND